MKRPASLTLLLVFGIVYLLWPRDLVPDAFGLIGRIDDFLLLLYVFYRLRRWRKADAETEPPPRREPPPREPVQAELDPYEVLGITRGASQEEIRAAYKGLAHQYHPDRVAHLGPELQELAHQKMLAIQQAYEELSDR